MAKILIFGVTKLSDMLAKGNIGYLRNYELAFDEVHTAYLIGDAKSLQDGNTFYRSCGTGSSIIDLFLAPFRLYKIAREVRPDLYLTADIWFSFWTAIMVRMILGAKIVLMPVCLPDELYASTGRTETGLPRWIDKTLIWLSFKSASFVLTGSAFGSFVNHLMADPLATKKLIVTSALVDAMPSHQFFVSAKGLVRKQSDGNFFKIVTVARLSREKLIDHLLRMMTFLPEEFRLVLIGDGNERAVLENMAETLRVRHRVEFKGAIANGDIPAEMMDADVFVSAITGSSLREAMILGVPVVAYDRDWLKGFFRDGEMLILAKDESPEALARGVETIRSQPKQKTEAMVSAAKQLADELWTPDAVRSSMRQVLVATH